MKTFLLFFVVIFYSCHDTVEVPEKYWGTSSMTINGKAELFKPYCFPHDSTVNIYLDGFQSTDFLKYELVFGNINTKQYRVDTFKQNSVEMDSAEYATFFTFLSDGDVLGNVYNALENGNNYLEITEWNDVTHELKGKFEINLLIDRTIPPNDPNSPDTLRITNGQFHTRIK